MKKQQASEVARRWDGEVVNEECKGVNGRQTVSGDQQVGKGDDRWQVVAGGRHFARCRVHGRSRAEGEGLTLDT
jgi:hypothetical protein